MERFVIVEGSSRPILDVLCKDVDGLPYDFTGFQNIKLTVATSFETTTPNLIMDLSMTNPSLGVARKQFTSAESTVAPGDYLAMVEATFAAGDTRKFGPFYFTVLSAVRKPGT